MFGLYYKHVTFVNDVSRVISELRHNLEHHCRVVHYHPRGIIYINLLCLLYRHHLQHLSIDDHNGPIVQANGVSAI